MSTTDNRSGYDPESQLMQLQELCRRRSRVLYRDQALYLQVLRDELLERTRQALFTLISNVEPSVLLSCRPPVGSVFRAPWPT